MVIRPITAEDTVNFFEMMCFLDEETEYMMYEPGERRERTKDLSRLKANIAAASSGGDLIFVAENDLGDIVGYIWGQRGEYDRVHHVAYIVIGIRKAYRGQGIGTRLFELLEDWAKESGVVRLELTVECPNEAAIGLYEKQGFVIEGTRSKAMKLHGEFVDEYYMAKILG